MVIRFLRSLFILSFILLLSCKPACPINSCHIRKQHLHGKKVYRGQPLWKRQNPKIGQGLPRKPQQDNQETQKKAQKKK